MPRRFTRAGLNPDIVMAANQLAISIGQLHQDYREYNDGLEPLLPPILDAETGSISAYRLSYTALIGHFYVQGARSFANGKTAYDGFLQPVPPVTPAKTVTDNTIDDFDVKLGAGFALGSMTVIVPYADLGVHTWIREVGKATPNYGGAEKYSNLIAGVGVKVLFSPVSRLVFEAGATTGTTAGSNMNTNGTDYPLGKKPYLAADIGVDYRFVGAWHLKATADYQKWEYGASDWIAGAMEPHSQTKQFEYLLSLGYTF